MLKRSLFSSIFMKSLFFQLVVSSLLIVTVASCACKDNRKPETEKKDPNREVAALDTSNITTAIQEAIAEIKSFKGDQVKGKVIFKKVPDGIRIVADVNGLTPGKHGFHVHEFGDCSGDGSAAGSHFNPSNSKHGGPDSPERHVGDLGNIVADVSGYAHYERVDKIISFEGVNSILGRSIIIHADPDDYTTQPTGASGAKIACGLITPIAVH